VAIIPLKRNFLYKFPLLQCQDSLLHLSLDSKRQKNDTARLSWNSLIQGEPRNEFNHKPSTSCYTRRVALVQNEMKVEQTFEHQHIMLGNRSLFPPINMTFFSRKRTIGDLLSFRGPLELAMDLNSFSGRDYGDGSYAENANVCREAWRNFFVKGPSIIISFIVLFSMMSDKCSRSNTVAMPSGEDD
jgi:hypothetical protein